MSSRTRTPASYVHEAAVYGSDAELLHLVVPHLQAGIAAGQPTIAALHDHESGLVRTALDNPKAVTFLPGLTANERPPAVIDRLTSLLGHLAARGAEQIRLVTTIPHPGLGAPWDGWCRYEAAINELLAAFPAWGMCLYDRRITPRDVLGHVELTHPQIASDGSHLPNHRYQDPRAFVLTLTPPPDPLEATSSAVEMVDPTPAAGRHAVRNVARSTGVGREDVEHLLTATSEAVTNALLHGRPPVTMKVWAAADRIVVTVHDCGPGPQDPHGGLVPGPQASGGGGGFGLWIMHQLLPVTYQRKDGFTIRLVGGKAMA